MEKMNPAPFVLASVITAYPDEGFHCAIRELCEDENLEIPAELRSKLEDFIADEGKVDDLRSEYIATFDQSKSLNPLYETEYGRNRPMFKAAELADIAGFYRAFGFEIDPEASREMPDHVSVELEFYSLLMMKARYLLERGDQAGFEILSDGMRKFMTDHLGRFVSSILSRQGTQNSDFYSTVFQWVNSLVVKECERIGARPESLAWYDNEVESEVMCCGGVAAKNS